MTRPPDLTRAARTAWRVLIARSVTVLPVDPLAILKACRDTCVMSSREAGDILGLTCEQIENLFDGADAVTLRQLHRGSARYIVIYRGSGNPARLRFTLAHELGHRLLGHTCSDAAEEREADHFASHLLCPEPVAMRLRDRFGILPVQKTAMGCYISPSCVRTAQHRPHAADDSVLYQQVDALLGDAAEDLCRGVK